MKTYATSLLALLLGLTVTGHAWAFEHPRDAASKAHGNDYQFWVQSPTMHPSFTTGTVRGQEFPATGHQVRQHEQRTHAAHLRTTVNMARRA